MNIFENFQNFFKKPVNEVITESSGVVYFKKVKIKNVLEF